MTPIIMFRPRVRRQHPRQRRDEQTKLLEFLRQTDTRIVPNGGELAMARLLNEVCPARSQFLRLIRIAASFMIASLCLCGIAALAGRGNAADAIGVVALILLVTSAAIACRARMIVARHAGSGKVRKK
jgi:hypothetical protein